MGLKKDENAILADLYDSQAWKVFKKKYLEKEKETLAKSAMALLEGESQASAITLARYQGAAQRLAHIENSMHANYLKIRKREGLD